MASLSTPDPAVIFQEALPDIFPEIGKDPYFTSATMGLLRKVINGGELNEIKAKGFADHKRGSELTLLLMGKIESSEDPRQCLLDICDVLESKGVKNKVLQKQGELMRKKLLGTTETAGPITTAKVVSDPKKFLEAELDKHDLDQVLEVLKEAQFGAAHWKSLGLKLKVYIDTLDTIGRTNGNADDYLQATIQKWLIKVDGVKKATWQILIEAVKKTDDKAAAERIPSVVKNKLED